MVALKIMKCFKVFKEILYTLKFSNNYLIKCSAQTLTELTKIENKYEIRILFYIYQYKEFRRSAMIPFSSVLNATKNIACTLLPWPLEGAAGTQ